MAIIKKQPSGEWPVYSSATLQQIKPENQPKPLPACGTCPAAIWFATDSDLKCWCTRMHSIAWTTKESAIMVCDGREIALAELAAKLEALATKTQP